MAAYRSEIHARVAETIRNLPPELKRALRAAIRLLADNPAAGEPLVDELRGRFKYRVRRYRIVYRVDRAARIVHIIAFGHRRNVYEELMAREDESE